MSHIHEIKHELLLMKEELQACLMEQHQLPVTIQTLMKDELMDVERALWKLENGQYGLCEETSQLIPFEKLHVYPTARTLDDFSFQNFFENREMYS